MNTKHMVLNVFDIYQYLSDVLLPTVSWRFCRNSKRLVGRDGSAEELERERLVRSRLQWAGQVEMMVDDRLPKRAAELREEGRMRRRCQG